MLVVPVLKGQRGKGDKSVESCDEAGTHQMNRSTVTLETPGDSASLYHPDDKTHALLIGFIFFATDANDARIKTCSSHLQGPANHFSKSPRSHRTLVRRRFFILNTCKPFCEAVYLAFHQWQILRMSAFPPDAVRDR